MDYLFGIQILILLFCFGYAKTILNQTLVVEKGETVKLPCSVAENADEDEPILWIRNETALYIGHHLMRSNDDVTNIKLDGDSFTLVIANFSSPSNGAYTCRIAIALDSITYYVRVKEPPVVESIEGETAIEIGDDLNLNCIAKGFPTPNVTWYRQKTLLSERQNFHNEENIYFENVDASVSGIYTCVASYEENEDLKSVTVIVFHGVEAESKRVFAEPPAEDTRLCCLLNRTKEINWLKQGRNITFNDRITVEAIEHKSCLVIHQVEFQDLGTYLCQTKNLRQIATIDLTGFPKQPLLTSYTNNTVTWKIINSVFPIQEYSIFIKNSADIYDSWKFIKSKKITVSDENEFIITHTFSDVSSGIYDVKLEVANRINANQVINYDVMINGNTTDTTNLLPQVLVTKSSASCFTISVFCLVSTVLTIWRK